MKKRSGFFVLALGGMVSFAWGQGLPDTAVQLQTVPVEEQRSPIARQTGMHHWQADSLLLRVMPAGSVADWLQWQGGATVRSYGPNGIATLSVRGSSSQQQTVLWDGLSLLNPMNSTPDLNLLPLWLFSDMVLQPGGNSSDFGSGAMGGALHLGHQRPEKSSFGAFIEQRSFNDRAAGLRYTHRAKQWWYTARGLHRSADNNFTFVNTARFGNPTDTLRHAQHQQLGLMQELGWEPGKNHRFKVRWWLQANRRQLPPSMTMARSTAVQADSASRLFASWEYSKGAWQLYSKQAWLAELNHYADPTNNFNEHHRFNAWLNESGLRYQKKTHAFQGHVQQAFYLASSPNFAARQSQHRLALVPSWQVVQGKHTSQIRLRAEWVDGQRLPLMPSWQHDWRFTARQQLQWNLARTYRLPTFNDLYWQPGGNEDLQPEQGWSAEMGWKWHPALAQGAIELRTGLFAAQVDNWIIWLPHPQQAFWQPQNFRLVRTGGIEQQINWQYRWRKWRLRAHADYAWVHATNRSTQATEATLFGKQLVYVPRHQFRSRLFAEYGPFLLSWNQNWTGLRFTASDNSASLPAYALNGLLAGYQLALGKQQLLLQAGIQNVFNTRYQAVAFFPMPGRHYQLNLRFQL